MLAPSGRLPGCCRAVVVWKPLGSIIASIGNHWSARQGGPPLHKEAVMGQPIPAQHPSVVLRSHFKLLKALLAVALAAVIALSAAVVIVADDDDQLASGGSAAGPVGSINYGGFNPAIGRPDSVQQQALPPGTRFDGGPDEGTRGIQPQTVAPGTRFDGGPDEGTRGIEAQPVAPRQSYAGGPGAR